MEIRANGSLVHDGIVIGQIDEGDDAPEATPGGPAKITLDLGWCKAADVHVVVRGESGRDARRVILDR